MATKEELLNKIDLSRIPEDNHNEFLEHIKKDIDKYPLFIKALEDGKAVKGFLNRKHNSDETEYILRLG